MLYQYRRLPKARENEVAQSCPTLCDPIDCSLPGSSIHGILQARVLEWGAIALFRDLPDPGRSQSLALLKNPQWFPRKKSLNLLVALSQYPGLAQPLSHQHLLPQKGWLATPNPALSSPTLYSSSWPWGFCQDRDFWISLRQLPSPMATIHCVGSYLLFLMQTQLWPWLLK